MKKVLLLLVGGTICTAINEKGNLSVHEKMGIYASLLTNRLMCISHLPCTEKERMRQFPKIAEHETNGHRIRFLYGFTEETAYAKLVIAYSLFDKEEERRKYIETECNFERIYCIS